MVRAAPIRCATSGRRDWDEFRRFQDAAGGRIRLVTLAPEHEGALLFIERLVGSGVVVALGHTAAARPAIRAAIAAGAGFHASGQRLAMPCCRATTITCGSSWRPMNCGPA